MTEPAQKPIPSHVLFEQLEHSHAWKQLSSYADEVIAAEREQYWKLAKDERDAQHALIQNFEDFWGRLRRYVTNAQNHPNKK
jgi:hypothetical protein